MYIPSGKKLLYKQPTIFHIHMLKCVGESTHMGYLSQSAPLWRGNQEACMEATLDAPKKKDTSLMSWKPNMVRRYLYSHVVFVFIF